MRKRYICTKTTYQKDGQDKNWYNRVGELLELEGKNGGTFFKLNLYWMPGTEYHIFDDKKEKDPFG